jgi:hypothetical protein
MSDATLTIGATGAAAAPATPTSTVMRGRAAAALILGVDLGILGDVLFRAPGLGVNFTIWWWALIAAAIWVTRTGGMPLDRRRLLLFGAAAAIATLPALRMAPDVVLLTCAALGTLLVLAAWTGGAPGSALSRSALSAYMRAGIATILHALRGPVPLLAAEARAFVDVRERHAARSAAVVRGLAIAAPIVLVFTMLLVSADPSFEGLVSSLFAWDVETVASHAILLAVFGWVAASYLSASLASWEQAPAGAPKPMLGMIEASVVLTAVDVLFLTFMLAQLRYLFGGAEHVLSTAGLTYAEYARRGFFELVVVTGLALPLLVGIFAAVQPETARQARARRLLSLALIVLLTLMIGSALWRMHLYEQMFGWTVLRLYSTALMLWIAATLLWFARTTLRGRAERFPFAPLLGGVGLFAALGVANPAGVVLTVNAHRAQAGADFDGFYAATLRDDAVPILVRVLPVVAPTLNAGERCAIASTFDRARDSARPTGGWRGWNLSRARARRAIGENWHMVEQALGPSPCPAPTTPSASPPLPTT